MSYQLKTNTPPPTPFTVGRLFLIWLQIGATSFGGGPVTQYMIQENFIYKYRWISAEEYTNILAICQVAPGINLFAITILIGKRLAGWVGIALSLLGLILPSALITIGITSIYASFRESPKVQAMLHTVFAAIFGISLATTWRNAKPVFKKNREQGSLAFWVSVGIVTGCALIFLFFNPPVIYLYLLGGLSGAFAYGSLAKNKRGNNQ